MSMLIFLVTGLIVGVIARALVSGRDPGTGIVLLIGTVAQVIAWALLRATPLARYGQPWSFFASVAVGAVLLSFYNDIAPSRSVGLPATAVADQDGLPPPFLPPPRRPFGSRAADASGLALTGALLMGVTGFLIGFFGPMKFQPWANQGPMVGLFLTGPGGALLGGIVGVVLGFVQPAWPFRRRMLTLNLANVAWGLFVLDLVVDRSWWH